MITVTNATGIAAMTLRVNTPNDEIYTSSPMIPLPATQTAFNLPRFADTADYKSTFIFLNPNDAPSTVTITSTTGTNGVALPITLTDTATPPNTYTSGTPFTVGGKKSIFMTTDGSANNAGSASISATSGLGVAALFSYFSGGVVRTEVGVLDSPAQQNFTMPIDARIPIDGSGQTDPTAVNTGFALFNPSTSNTVTLTPTYIDTFGVMTTGPNVVLGPLGSSSKYIDQAFSYSTASNGSSIAGNFQGSLAFHGVTTNDIASAVALRQNLLPYNLTSYTVVTGTAQGGYPAVPSSLLYVTATPVYTNIKTGGSFNKYLPYMQKLTITETGFTTSSTWTPVAFNVISQDTGRVYQPLAVPTTTSGTVYIPGGNYIARVSGYITGTQWEGVWGNYTTTPFVFTGTTTQTVTAAMPAPSYHSVTGTLANWDSFKTTYLSSPGTIGTAGIAQMSFYGTVTSNQSVSYVVYCNTDTSGNGTFTHAFPDGDYQAVLFKPYALSYGGVDTTQNMGILVGTFSVNGADLSPTLTIPTISTVSGTANSGSAISPFALEFTDKAQPSFGYINGMNNNSFPFPNSYSTGSGYTITTNPAYTSYPGSYYYPRNSAFVQNTFGSPYGYSLPLVGDGHVYDADAQFMVYTGSGTSAGLATYSPAAAKGIVVSNSGATFNLPIPSTIPATVALTGKVLKFDQSQVQANAFVIARSTAIMGTDGNVIPNLSYYTWAVLTSTGGYSYTLNLLPGYYEIYYGSGNTTMIQ